MFTVVSLAVDCNLRGWGSRFSFTVNREPSRTRRSFFVDVACKTEVHLFSFQCVRVTPLILSQCLCATQSNDYRLMISSRLLTHRPPPPPPCAEKRNEWINAHAHSGCAGAGNPPYQCQRESKQKPTRKTDGGPPKICPLSPAAPYTHTHIQRHTLENSFDTSLGQMKNPTVAQSTPRATACQGHSEQSVMCFIFGIVKK